jgi:hypothetical protein
VPSVLFYVVESTCNPGEFVRCQATTPCTLLHRGKQRFATHKRNMVRIYSRTVVRWAACYVIDFTVGWSFGEPQYHRPDGPSFIT